MPSKPKSEIAGLLYVGIQGNVVAVRMSDGTIAWNTKLRAGSSFVPIVQEGDRIYAASGGEVSCLDSATGTVLWHNRLRGLGAGYAALAGGGFPISAAALDEAAQASAAGAAVTATS
jgi:outer membrane protein assembly factor BamB